MYRHGIKRGRGINPTKNGAENIVIKKGGTSAAAKADTKKIPLSAFADRGIRFGQLPVEPTTRLELVTC